MFSSLTSDACAKVLLCERYVEVHNVNTLEFIQFKSHLWSHSDATFVSSHCSDPLCNVMHCKAVFQEKTEAPCG